MPRINKNGTREVRAYEILKAWSFKFKGWKRLDLKKLSPTIAYGLYTRIQPLGGVETRIYSIVVLQWQGEGKAPELVAATVRGDLIAAEDWLASFKRLYKIHGSDGMVQLIKDLNK